MRNALIAAAAGALLCIASGGAASAADYGYGGGSTARSASDSFYRGYTGRLPSCADPHVHRQIRDAFAKRERMYWHSGLALSGFVRPAELGYRSWGVEFIPRRFCSAEAFTNDGVRRHVYWLVAEGQQWLSLGPGVDWCVTGLDRNYAYAPDCKMARP
ncbi:hypothetical protein [Hansschlegelia beijingensis]|uniref:Uncharacterized protein n=1 Tax=Hansschlegelia beijingensis TaxID=1133344 RepID=A0A7W6GD86_9HYPH|nr:hypothetical protein [Hansschlegelia beijingensis]MBB3971581.1 hypothetical protein [Hansschlegelia beijingensis]